ncbi:MAG: response regulator transcription factor [Helicobacteraceae bacterium]|jgi:two-component system OmpR family response regulator|nr:response regulator transcription factor [Helicobacteraceae bacterium]
MTKVLLIEDDAEITALLSAFLVSYGMEVLSFENPLTALNSMHIESYDVVLLDLTLPEIDGLEVCRRIREHYDIPIIISSARHDLADKVVALDYGADDYLPKPYEPRELVARIQRHVRRHAGSLAKQPSHFSIDSERMQIVQDGRILDLTLAEYELLALLIKNAQKVVSRDFIANNVNAISWESSDRSIDVLISRIRHKIEEEPRKPLFIRSIRSIGYKFTE